MTEQFYLTASDLADEVGIKRQTVYYYEEQGLISPVTRTKKIKLYNRRTLERLKKIMQFKNTYKLEALKDKLDKGEL
jgi:DNA-binding transcriptional MerR regulator